MITGINHYCVIASGKVLVDGKELYKDAKHAADFSEFIRGVYRHFEINYPKFYKMDPLCQISVVAMSILIEKTGMVLNEKAALLLSNKSSCIDIDKKHLASISDAMHYYPSPANFVYTLPNIALGEISIKYKLRSENSFFIFDFFNPNFMVNYAQSLIELKQVPEVVCGWMEVNENNYKAIIYKVEEKGKIAHEADQVLNFDSK